MYICAADSMPMTLYNNDHDRSMLHIYNLSRAKNALRVKNVQLISTQQVSLD